METARSVLRILAITLAAAAVFCAVASCLCPSPLNEN